MIDVNYFRRQKINKNLSNLLNYLFISILQNKQNPHAKLRKT
jgi:hypothetical protein